MVKLPGKLLHLDFAHKRRLLEEEHPNMPLLQEYFLTELEEGTYRYLSQQQAAYKRATGEKSGPQMTPRAAAAYSTETRKIVEPDFFLDLVRRQTGNLRSSKPMSDVPAYRRHLIWQVPEPYLVRSLRNQRLLDTVLGTKPAAEGDTSPHPLATRGYGLISRALDIERQWLEKVPPEAWARGELYPVGMGAELRTLLVAQFEEADAVPETFDRKTKVATSNILRWALTASDAAPPNLEVMEFLGREESLKRISKAAAVARKVAEEPDWQPDGFYWSEVSEVQR